MSWKTYRGILQLLGGHRERLVVPPEREEPKSHAVPAEIAQAPQGVAGGRRSDVGFEEVFVAHEGKAACHSLHFSEVIVWVSSQECVHLLHTGVVHEHDAIHELHVGSFAGSEHC